MGAPELDAIARALLYEGYALYPYRASSLKNRQRWFFGGVYPPAWSEAHPGDAACVGTQVLLEPGPAARVTVSARFLQHSTGEATEREVAMPEVAVADLLGAPRRQAFAFDALLGELELGAHRAGTLVRLVASANNISGDPGPERDAALASTMAALHLVLQARDGAFVSVLEPTSAQAPAVAALRQDGLYPVLVGLRPARDVVLAAPIALYDYPRVAPESPADLFDGTEIDEILTLRVLTLSDAEQAELAQADARVRGLLARVKSLGPDELRRLHGAQRLASDAPCDLSAGTRVRLRPRAGGEVFDLALEGRLATVTAVERDFDGGAHVAVVLDDDPGADLGREGFHGHRFFFRASEVEPL